MSDLLTGVASSLLGGAPKAEANQGGDLFGQLLQLATTPQAGGSQAGSPAPGSAGTSAKPLLPSVRTGTDTGGQVREQPLSSIICLTLWLL